MFDHVTIRVSGGATSVRFYETVLGSIGIEKTGSAGDFGEGCEEFAEWDDFSLAPADSQHPITTGLHLGLGASSRDEVDRFWRTGVDAGYRDDGAPGPRPQYGDDYYGGFLLDPDGNSAEAVIHGGVRPPGNIDHLWIRVPDLDAAAVFYESISEFSGFQRRSRRPGRVHFQGK